MNTPENRALWNARATLGETAGTQDLILVQLERRALREMLADLTPQSSVLEVGCGLGETAKHLASTLHGRILATDNSPEMIARCPPALGVKYLCAELLDLTGTYDAIYTQRMLINLPDQTSQIVAIRHLQSLLAPDGRLVLCESCAEGVAMLNLARQALGLPDIMPPPHARYLSARVLEELGLARWDFSSTYYFLSRVVNAKLSAIAGIEPAYDSPINGWALDLPLAQGPYAQTAIWTWRKP